MGPFNTVFNGYRDLILPLSEQDQTVKSAVLAAAASHISLKHCGWKPLASKADDHSGNRLSYSPPNDEELHRITTMFRPSRDRTSRNIPDATDKKVLTAFP
ncbi:unnamed protein product [Aspergillus oryzae var. brunneus]|uniref:Unnamed protein product n=1 Tax=Aspergillus oryzae var. brunneus TaxID=332754 RepID=A0ABQ6L516_ASPOZ|nr:unnamed protein product [Aspergillus oryzae]GMG49626.1 unnamed protein product [Aspergillus oryzae var. brunneus]